MEGLPGRASPARARPELWCCPLTPRRGHVCCGEQPVHGVAVVPGRMALAVISSARATAAGAQRLDQVPHACLSWTPRQTSCQMVCGKLNATGILTTMCKPIPDEQAAMMQLANGVMGTAAQG